MKSLNKKRAIKYIAMALGIMFCVSVPRVLFAQVSKERLTVAYAAMNAFVLPLWIAAEKGFFAREGLDGRLVFIRTSPVIVAAINSGEIQAGYTAGTAALSAATRGLDLQIVANTRSKLTYQIVTKPEIKSAADLKGKIFGVQAIGGTVWMGAMLGLEHLGLDPERDKIKVIAIGDQTVLAQALESRRIDATVLDPDLAIPMSKKGFRTLSDLSQGNIALAGTGLVFRKSFVSEKRETVEKAVRAFIRAMGYLFDPRNKAEVLEILLKKLGLPDRASAEGAYSFLLEAIDHKPYPTISGLKNVQRLMTRFYPEIARVKIGEIIEMSFVEKLDKSGFIDEAFRTGGRAP